MFAGTVRRSAGTDQTGRVRHDANQAALATQAVAQLAQGDARRDGHDQMLRGQAGGDFREQGRQRLRLDGEHKQVAGGDDRAVIGNGGDAGFLLKSLAGSWNRVAGEDTAGRDQTSLEPTARQSRRHFAGAEKTDSGTVIAAHPWSLSE